MGDATAIDVTDKAPRGRVVGKLPTCPSWCTFHDYGSSADTYRLIHSHELPSVHALDDDEIIVGLATTDEADETGTVRRIGSGDVVISGGDGHVSFDLHQAAMLAERIAEALTLAEADFEKQMASGNYA